MKPQPGQMMLNLYGAKPCKCGRMPIAYLFDKSSPEWPHWCMWTLVCECGQVATGSSPWLFQAVEMWNEHHVKFDSRQYSGSTYSQWVCSRKGKYMERIDL